MNLIKSFKSRIGLTYFGLSLIFQLITGSNAYALKIQNDSNPAREVLIKYLFNNVNPEVRTDSVIIVRNGRILFEGYRDDKYKVHKVWSISKALTNAMVGIAVREQKLGIDNSLCDFYPDLSFEKCKIKVKHLLQWSSGLEWSEEYSETPEKSTVLQMFYGDGASDITNFVLNRPYQHEPESHWRYSSGDTQLLMGILKKIYSKTYESLPNDRLFKPLGMNETFWEKDDANSFFASSHVFSSVRDLARFGQLFLNNGVISPLVFRFDGSFERLLPMGWVEFSSRVSEAYSNALPLEQGSWGENTPAGAGWWANIAMLKQGKPAPWPAVPADTFAARGFRGQYLFVIPQLRTIIVRLGFDTTNTAFDANHMLKLSKDLFLSENTEGERL